MNREFCRAQHDRRDGGPGRWVCNKRPGHGGLHQTKMRGRILAVWATGVPPGPVPA